MKDIYFENITFMSSDNPLIQLIDSLTIQIYTLEMNRIIMKNNIKKQVIYVENNSKIALIKDLKIKNLKDFAG